MTTDNPYLDESKDLEAATAMDQISKTTFAPVYPLLAQQILEIHGIRSGTCIDLGSGPGALSIALAKITRLEIHALDQSPSSTRIAKDNVRNAGLESQVYPVQKDVTQMPFEDGVADLIISRGSIFFWTDKTAAFNEIFRVLKPGGKTHIGGGFGSESLKQSIFDEMMKKDPGFKNKAKCRMSPEKKAIIRKALDDSDVQTYEISESEKGFWIHISKEAQ
ncbi:MAG: class I SAM-dependent methyltransferase [Desulfobacteraceae bacterium]|nr:MAG: class I SAM-dependent methyltransferase [Desulfobacteraceae bacterium]